MILKPPVLVPLLGRTRHSWHFVRTQPAKDFPRPMIVMPLQTAKWCANCGQDKPFVFFPRDRSRPDGRWHTCRLCNAKDWQTRGKVLALRRKYRRVSCSGLQGLRQCQRGKSRFASLPPELRPTAQQLLSRYLDKHAHRMTPALHASLVASAASHAPLVGSRSWGLSMRAKKGWRTRERRRAQSEAVLTEIRAKNAGKARVSYGLGGHMNGP